MDQSLNNAPGVTPPLELVQQWEKEAVHERDYNAHLATRAAQWGADQELEACCALIEQKGFLPSSLIRAARRPKPPSLKEQALDAHNRMMVGEETQDDWAIVRRALEQLDD